MKPALFSIIYGPSVREHILSVDKAEHSFIRDMIEHQLAREPHVESRNRKPLKQPVEDGADWELRFGDQNRYRVFYRCDLLRREVRVLALGIKDRNRLLIGGKEVKL